MPPNDNQSVILKDIKTVITMTNSSPHHVNTVAEALLSMEYSDVRKMLNIWIRPDYDTFHEFIQKKNTTDERDIAWQRAIRKYKTENRKLQLANREIRKLERKIGELENASRTPIVDHLNNDFLGELDLDERINLMRK